MNDYSLLSRNARPGHPSGARRPADSRGNVEAGGGAITVTIGGSAALIVIGAILRWGLPGSRRQVRVPGPCQPGPGRYQASYLALPAARYHPPGVEQDRAGLDGLGRIPSEQKEKETSWLS